MAKAAKVEGSEKPTEGCLGLPQSAGGVFLGATPTVSLKFRRAQDGQAGEDKRA